MLCVACLAEDGAPRDECAPGWVDTELGGNFNLPNAKRSKTATATTFPRLLEFLYFATVSNCFCVEAPVCGVVKKGQRCADWDSSM